MITIFTGNPVLSQSWYELQNGMIWRDAELVQKPVGCVCGNNSVFSNTTVCLGKELVKRFFFGEFSRVWAPVCDVVCFAACRTLRERSWNSEGKLKSKLTKIIMMIATTQYKTRFYQITEKSQFFTHNSIICSGEFVTWCRSQLLCCQFCSKQRNMAAKALWGERSEIF